MSDRQTSVLYTRNFIFGVEDSLVSTVGLLSGVAAAQVDKPTIFLTGLILIFVEAFSMGVGSFLSEQTAEEYTLKDEKVNQKTITGSLIMFASYFVSGFVPLFPYVIFETAVAFAVSIIASLLALFALGFVSAQNFGHKDTLRHGLRMFVIGGLAILVGVLVGKIVQR